MDSSATPTSRNEKPDHINPDDRHITSQALLGEQGYTVRGVQQLLAQEAKAPAVPVAPIPRRAARIIELRAIRAQLAAALAADD